VAYEDDDLTISWKPLRHRVPCLGYRLEEHGRPGRFDPDRARALGVPEGPLWGALQRGEHVHVEGRGEVAPGEILGRPRRGRAVAYCTDTAPCDTIEELCAGVDVAFVEGMFMPEHEEEGRLKMHLTVEQAAAATRRAGALRTVLVHLSPRYGAGDIRRIDGLARKVNRTARMGRDLMVIDVPLPD
jgi:ribonuclease Z